MPDACHECGQLKGCCTPREPLGVAAADATDPRAGCGCAELPSDLRRSIWRDYFQVRQSWPPAKSASKAFAALDAGVVPQMKGRHIAAISTHWSRFCTVLMFMVQARSRSESRNLHVSLYPKA